MMVLPLAVFLAYCSGPNNTQTTTDTDMNHSSNSASASKTETPTDVSDVNTNSSSVSGVTATTGTTSAAISGTGSTTSTTNMDTLDPMSQHFQRTNGQNWTWDMNYPGYDRPTAGTYNSAVNGDWQLVMTPELVSAWRQDNSRSLWTSGYAYNGRFLGGNTYVSASESFDTKSSNTLSGSSTMNGTSTMNSGTSTLGSGSASTQDLSGTGSTTNSLDVNSISYNAANGNMYQLPKFNLYLDNGSFTGYTGCNSVSGRFSVSGNSLQFMNTQPSTNIECLGGLDQTVLLDLLRRVNSYSYVGDELQLMQGNQVLLRFKKNTAGATLQ